MAGFTSVLVEIYADPHSPVQVGWVKMGCMGESKRPWVIANDPPMGSRKKSQLLEDCSTRTCKASFCTFANTSESRDRMECLNSTFNMWPDKNFVEKSKHFELDVIGIYEDVCRQVAEQVIDVNDKNSLQPYCKS